MNQQSTQKFLIIATIAAMVLFVVGTFIANMSHTPERITEDSHEQPTLGNPKAPVKVIVFLEPKSKESKNFNDNVYPQIDRNFIVTNKISYTVIVVSYLADSQLAAMALQCVYYQDGKTFNNDLFFVYLNTMYRNQSPSNENWATEDKLLQMAKQASPKIDVDKLKKCLVSNVYNTQLRRNTDYAKRLIGTLETPAVFVNGVRVKDYSFKELSKAILMEMPAPATQATPATTPTQTQTPSTGVAPSEPQPN